MTAWDGERGRKTVHLGMAVLPVWIYFMPPPWSFRGPFLAFLVLLAIDGVRLRSARAHRWFDARIGAYLRPGEHRGLISMHYVTGTAALLAAVAPPALAAFALANLVFGDAAAALAGRRFGRPARVGKSPAGSAACFVVCLAAGLLLFPDRPAVAWTGAAAATLAESVPLGLDDNLTIPLATAAAVAWLL